MRRAQLARFQARFYRPAQHVLFQLLALAICDDIVVFQKVLQGHYHWDIIQNPDGRIASLSFV